ncbi:MAG: response regulator [Elainellaceae cyanobacterium]
MNDAIPDLDTANHQLMGLDRLQKPKMLIVDDEPDNLDLLYRTFRRDFQVLRAANGIDALNVLAREGEVAIIISDQRMPEMKGTEFLSKTVPQFPDTMRIILTGFTDVEDLVEAINSGQVHKYITKPWDPNELKLVVQRATETYQQIKHRSEELHQAQAQTALLNTIMLVTREASSLDCCLRSIAEAVGRTFDADICTLQLTDENALSSSYGTYPAIEHQSNSLAHNPLINEAIATRTLQVAVNNPADNFLTNLEYYAANGIQTNLVNPITFQDNIVGVLSLEWKTSRQLNDAQLALLYLLVQHVALALACKRMYCATT